MANGEFTSDDRKLLQATHTDIKVIGKWIEGHEKSHVDKEKDCLVHEKRMNSHADDIKDLTGWKYKFIGIVTAITVSASAIVYYIIEYTDK